MGPADLLIHLLNFAAPAAFVAACVASGARLLMKRSSPALSWWLLFAINFVVCLAVSLLGLWYFGQDGRIATYAALVVACATSQWLAGRAWRG